MWLSSTAQQAIHAVLSIARARGEPLRVGMIAAATDLPRNYLSKTLHALARAGVLTSERGPRGGFRLARAPGRVTLAAVIAPFVRPGQKRCLLGRPTCGDANPCRAHQQWSEVAATMEEYFRTTTIAHLLGDTPMSGDASPSVTRYPNRRKPHGSVSRTSR